MIPHAPTDAALPTTLGAPAPVRTVDLTALRSAAESIARDAGALVLRHYEHGVGIDFKGDVGNVVTDADRASEALIVAALAERFPTHGVVAEEGGGSVGGVDGAGADSAAVGAVTWLVDPLDGTNNFASGFPVFAVTLAAVADGEILAGATYDPLRDEMYSAHRGGGATLNGRPMAVSRQAQLAAALVGTGFAYDKATAVDNNLAEVITIVPLVRGLRRAGACALDLAWVAAGRLDAFWERGPVAWDLAAGVLLVQEAGGRVTGHHGEPLDLDGGRVLATNGVLHAMLLERLAAARTLIGQLPMAAPARPDDDPS
ncbi:MAG: inositol monophosphatase family protein [Ardenticatenales bacterium]